MISEISLISAHGKAFAASVSLMFLAVVDILAQPTEYEWIIKTGAAGLIIFLIRVILKGWDDHRKSMDDHRTTLETTVKANTDAMNKVHISLDRQIEFFDGIGKDAIHRAIDPAFSLAKPNRNEK